jgi:hypothetical protein
MRKLISPMPLQLDDFVTTSRLQLAVPPVPTCVSFRSNLNFRLASRDGSDPPRIAS